MILYYKAVKNSIRNNSSSHKQKGPPIQNSKCSVIHLSNMRFNRLKVLFLFEGYTISKIIKGMISLIKFHKYVLKKMTLFSLSELGSIVKL